ncbi:hypothetical protein OS493_032924 [Desmophyllum pertusum]|uniref:RNA helicase n=1 Tax=Desmophyllum pertusum TaxID=174260 RepID=A0A9X0CID4_9CNID|nr:hypothetical protein OS493_032924 [Desmophyllum pertusum]
MASSLAGKVTRSSARPPAKPTKRVKPAKRAMNPAFTPDKDVDFKLQVSSFSELGLREDVLKALYNLKVTTPTVIQMVTIPRILKREHVLCAAQTGTGKTLAYLAPLVHHLREDERTHGIITRPKRPRACIVVPGRELGVQVLDVAKEMCHHARFRAVGIIGGRKRKFMKEDLRSPADLIIGTPGTLLQFRDRGNGTFLQSLL